MSANKQRLNESLINYDPPEWVSKLDNVPKHHVQVGVLFSLDFVDLKTIYLTRSWR